MKKDNLIYLDTYILQKDMRIRMPKSIITNMHVEKGVSLFQIYYDKMNECLILKPENNNNNNNNNNGVKNDSKIY